MGKALQCGGAHLEFCDLSVEVTGHHSLTEQLEASHFGFHQTVLDLYARKVVGWAMAPSMPAMLVCDALSMAVGQRQPAPGLIVHYDRGSQYASALYQEMLARHGFVCSMSRKGNCWDNAVAERFFLNLKMERVWQRQYANHAEAKAYITDYIVGFYNCKRINSALGNLPPTVYERKMAAREPIVVSGIT